MLSLKIALRFLGSGRTQTLLIISGIAIAISIQIFVGLLIGSLQKDLVDSTIGNSPQITISSSEDVASIRGWESLVARIDELKITEAIAVSASGTAFVRDGTTSLPIILRGFRYENADRIYGFSESLYQGRPYQSGKEALVGRELNEELELGIGDRLTITLPSGESSTLTVAGFYDLGTASINRSWVIANLQSVQNIFELGDRVTSIEMTVPDVFTADTVAHTIEQAVGGDNIKIDNWKELNADLLSALDGQRTSSTIIQAVIILSVVIAIASVLAISVLQKSRQIGILKAMGIRDRAASSIFIFQGLILGLIGSLLGITLGLGLFYGFNTFTADPDGTALITPYFDRGFIFRSWLIAVAASTLAGLLPARKSLRLNPIEVIREG